MRYCTNCGHVIDEYDFYRDFFNCHICGGVLSEDDMTALKYAELTEQEKDEYDQQLLNTIRNSEEFDEEHFNCYCSTKNGDFWVGFRIDKYAKFHNQEDVDFYSGYRKKNEPFKPFPPIDIEKARENAADSAMMHEKIRNWNYNTGAANVPKCPICQSTSLHKITNGQKILAASFGGIFGMNIWSKTYECNNCGSRF